MFLIVRRREIERVYQEGGQVHLFHGHRRDFHLRFDKRDDFIREYPDDESFAGAKKGLVVAIQTAYPLARFAVENRLDWKNKTYEIYLNFEKEKRHDSTKGAVGEAVERVLPGDGIQAGPGVDEELPELSEGKTV